MTDTAVKGKGKADPIDVYVGGMVRKFRLAAGINQTELAKGIGVTFQQVQKYEKGVNRVSASMLVRAAKTLGIHVAQLLPADDGEAVGPSGPPIFVEFAATPGALEVARAYVGAIKKDRVVFQRVAQAFLPPAEDTTQPTA